MSSKLTFEMRQNLAQGANYIFNITVRHAVKHWQADELLICPFGHGIFAAFVSEAILVVRMTMHRDVVDVHTNVFRAQRLEHFSSTSRELGQIQTYRIKMPGGINILASLRSAHTSHFVKLDGISGCDLPASFKIRFQLFH